MNNYLVFTMNQKNIDQPFTVIVQNSIHVYRNKNAEHIYYYTEIGKYNTIMIGYIIIVFYEMRRIDTDPRINKPILNVYGHVSIANGIVYREE